jgi:predicted Fe-Mo cluster-binding NifX family protein
MKLCFAVENDKGIESTVYGHFGSAPAFVIVDTEKENATSVANTDMQHTHGACNPFKAIGGQQVDAVVVGGIGAGALMKLNAEGIKVYRSAEQTVKANLELFKTGRLPELNVQHTCGGHQEGCAHS